jgi:hypothetical protein
MSLGGDGPDGDGPPAEGSPEPGTKYFVPRDARLFHYGSGGECDLEIGDSLTVETVRLAFAWVKVSRVVDGMPVTVDSPIRLEIDSLKKLPTERRVGKRLPITSYRTQELGNDDCPLRESDTKREVAKLVRDVCLGRL